MDTIQVTLAIAAAAIAAAVTFSKAKADTVFVDPASPAAVTLTDEQWPEPRFNLAGHVAIRNQGVLLEFRD